ncbi:hypothetical protein E2C01_092476 [Portunus trituberculatus]|uniref:Uncharacterized protein n=1 Tax=Portunus trituberculatus TaxID=210409 RepID=A0A5B7JVW7_PORTR|nr:hypothetical protein [Portunus trituberculatus]
MAAMTFTNTRSLRHTIHLFNSYVRTAYMSIKTVTEACSILAMSAMNARYVKEPYSFENQIAL